MVAKQRLTLDVASQIRMLKFDRSQDLLMWTAGHDERQVRHADRSPRVGQ